MLGNRMKPLCSTCPHRLNDIHITPLRSESIGDLKTFVRFAEEPFESLDSPLASVELSQHDQIGVPGAET